AVEREYLVARLQPGLLGGRAFLHHVNHDPDGDVPVIGEHAEVADLLAVLLALLRRDREREALPAALDRKLNRLPRRDRPVVLDLLPGRALAPVEGDDAVARAESRGLRRAPVNHVADDGRRHQGHAHYHGEDEGDGERRQDVHHRPGDGDRNLLPARAQVEALAGGNLLARALLQSGVRVVAAELDVAAERDEREAIVGRAPAAAPQALAEADREGLDAYAEQFGDQEVAELVQDDGSAEDEDEGKNPGHKSQLLKSFKSGRENV